MIDYSRRLRNFTLILLAIFGLFVLFTITAQAQVIYPGDSLIAEDTLYIQPLATEIGQLHKLSLYKQSQEFARDASAFIEASNGLILEKDKSIALYKAKANTAQTALQQTAQGNTILLRRLQNTQSSFLKLHANLEAYQKKALRKNLILGSILGGLNVSLAIGGLVALLILK